MKTLAQRKAHNFFVPDQAAGTGHSPAICTDGLLHGVQKIVNLTGPPGLLEERLKLPIVCLNKQNKIKPSSTVIDQDVEIPIRLIRIKKTQNEQAHSFSVLETPEPISVSTSQTAHIHPLKTRYQHRRRNASLPLLKNQLTQPADFFTKAYRKTPVDISSAKYSHRTFTVLQLNAEHVLYKVALIATDSQAIIQHRATPISLQNNLGSDQQIGTSRDSVWRQQNLGWVGVKPNTHTLNSFSAAENGF